MTLQTELKDARKKVVTDGYEMSLGELISAYKAKELHINPEFQRLYRWNIEQKSRFIESILLRIPVPPIFVYTRDDSTWELVDGLQRVSTILEFVGVLESAPNMETEQPLRLLGTKLLPSLEGKSWEREEAEDGGDNDEDASGEDEEENHLTAAQQLDLRRARIRVEILLKDSDERTKYELFQRLNTGGSPLSEQEVRNCVLVMINRGFYDWLVLLSKDKRFVHATPLSDRQTQEQFRMELVVRFLAFTQFDFERGTGVHEFLDDAARELARDATLNQVTLKKGFADTFQFIDDALGESAFRPWRDGDFKGRFSLSAFEVCTVGVHANLGKIRKMKKDDRRRFIADRTKKLWKDRLFKQHTKAGVQGSRRLANLLPKAHSYFVP